MNYLAIPGLTYKEKLKTSIEFRDYIIESVLEYYGLTGKQITKKTRIVDVTYPRQMLVYILKTKTSLCWREIGKMFRQDRTTIMNSFKTINDRRTVEDVVNRDVETILGNLCY